MIYVGKVTYGSSPATAAAEREIAGLRGDLSGTDTGMSGIDLVFVLGGRVRDVDFEGIRVGRLSKARQIVQIQVGLTRDVLAALEPGVTVLNLATQAIHVGAETLAAAGLDFSKDAALALLARPTTAAPLVGPAPQSAVVELHLADRPNGYSMTEITRVERLLEDLLGPNADGLVDGHELGTRSAAVFLVGDDLPSLVAAAAAVASGSDVARGATLVARDPQTGEARIVGRTDDPRL